MKKLMILLSMLSLLASCGEETLTVQNKEVKINAGDIEIQEVTTCSQMQFVKPAVDILYIVDNSGSTLASSFQAIKGQIQNTLSTVSTDFDYHIYVAPLNPSASDNIQTYPLIVSNTDSLPSVAGLNIVTSESLQMFAQASGNNQEYGFQRVTAIINNNRSNGIFRNNANTIIVMISNGDDTQSVQTIGGNTIPDPNVFAARKSELLGYLGSPMNADSIRFISLVAHSNCNEWKTGVNYKEMSKQIYDAQGFTDSSSKDSENLCSQNYAQLFEAVNNSIQAVVLGHKYDYWKISSASAANIQADDITVTKVTQAGSKTSISESSSNGFEYLGYRVNQNTRYSPSIGESQTGLMIKLNGTSRVEYPDCIIAKTRTPTEYFGYIALPRDPDLSTVKVTINGIDFGQSTTHGWSFVGFRDTQNIKVPGPTGASTSPALNKSGYILQLHGDAIYTNGQSLSVYYKPKTD